MSGIVITFTIELETGSETAALSVVNFPALIAIFISSEIFVLAALISSTRSI